MAKNSGKAGKSSTESNKSAVSRSDKEMTNASKGKPSNDVALKLLGRWADNNR